MFARGQAMKAMLEDEPKYASLIAAVNQLEVLDQNHYMVGEYLDKIENADTFELREREALVRTKIWTLLREVPHETTPPESDDTRGLRISRRDLFVALGAAVAIEITKEGASHVGEAQATNATNVTKGVQDLFRKFVHLGPFSR